MKITTKAEYRARIDLQKSKIEFYKELIGKGSTMAKENNESIARLNEDIAELQKQLDRLEAEHTTERFVIKNKETGQYYDNKFGPIKDIREACLFSREGAAEYRCTLITADAELKIVKVSVTIVEVKE